MKILTSKIIPILLAYGVLSCYVKQLPYNTDDAVTNRDTLESENLDVELLDRIGKTELTPLNSYFKLIIMADSTVKIEWGNYQINRESTRAFYFSEARRLRFDWENKDFIVLRAGRGSDSWFNVFLPMNNVDSDNVIENTLAHNEISNLVVAEYASNDTTMAIYNLKSLKVQYIVESSKCSSAFIHYCIDTLIFTDSELYYRWALPNKLEDDSDKFERRVRIEI